MFAVLRRKRRVLRVVLMRGRDINRLDVRIGAQRLDGCVTSGGKLLGKTLPGFGPRVRGRHQRDARISGKCRQHHAKCAAKTRYTKTELTFADAGASTKSGTFRSLILDI